MNVRRILTKTYFLTVEVTEPERILLLRALKAVAQLDPWDAAKNERELLIELIEVLDKGE